MENQKRSSGRLLLRTLTPSASSIVGSLVVMVVVIGFHMLLLSNQPELFLPHVAGSDNDQLTDIYENSILGPLDSLFGNDFMGVASTALIWGLTGWIVYSLIDLAITSYQDWRRSDEDIAYPGKNHIVRHPMHNQIITRLLVRFAVGVTAVGGLFIFRPIISTLFYHDIQFLRANSPVEMLQHAAAVIIGWLVILHIYVVLFRLFAFRTRVFGEIIE